MQIQNKYSTQFCLFFTKQVHQSEVSTDHFKWKYRIIILHTFVFCLWDVAGQRVNKGLLQVVLDNTVQSSSGWISRLLVKISLPSSTSFTWWQSSYMNIMSAASLDTSVPAMSMATLWTTIVPWTHPMFAFFKAGESLTPSHASHPGSVVPLTMNVCSLTKHNQGGFFFNLKRAPLNIQEHASRPPEFLVTPPGKDICKIKAPRNYILHLLCPPEKI